MNYLQKSLQKLGLSLDWDQELATCAPDYYRWTQWIFSQMLQAGFVDEVRALIAKYPSLTPESTSMRCVGYRQALEHLAGDYDVAELRDRGIFATRQLAKRQLTWLRGMDDILALDCLNPTLNELVYNEINQFIRELL